MITNELANRRLPSALAENISAANWPRRREELIKVFAAREYGFLPTAPPFVKGQPVKHDANALAGKADYTEISLSFPAGLGEFAFPVHIVIPKKAQNPPLVVYISFTKYPVGPYCPVEEIIDNGCAVAVFCYEDVTADKDDGFSSGLAPLYERKPGDKAGWGKISMWAFAASRVLDYVLTLDGIDKERIFCAGHSRLGKTAIWCGVNDTRFAGAWSNESGCSGAAISRGKGGESIEAITARFPYWFCENYRDYAGKEAVMPFDQNQLLSLMAPRLLYVSSAALDLWSDPKSEFLACAAASESYQLLGFKGLVHKNRFPRPGECLHGGRIGYHLRNGTHFLSRYDWQRFLRFIGNA